MTHTHNPAKHAAALLAAAALIFCLLVAPAAAFSGAGSGTEASPYIITTPAQLQEMANDLTAYYQLGDDIDLSGITSWSAIGGSISGYLYTSGFSGTLDGAGYTLSNLYVEKTSTGSAGDSCSFLVLANGGTVKNLKIEDFTIYQHSLTALATAYVPAVFQSVYNTQNYINNCEINARVSCDGIIFNNKFNAQSVFFVGNTVTDCILSGFVDAASSATTNYNKEVSSSAGSLSNFNNIYNNINTKSLNKVYAFDANQVSNSVYVGPTTALNPRIGESSTLSNNYVLDTVTPSSTNANSVNGADVSAATLATQSFYEDTLGWDFTNTWYWDESANLPKLQVFVKSVPPTISTVTATPGTGGQQTAYTLTTTATTEAAGGISGYQWSYSTDSGSTWTDINGATTNPYTWTPGQSISGTVNLKVTVTGADGGTADSYTEGFTPTITVITPPAISSITTSRPLQKVGSETTLTAIFSDSQTGNTYQWYYRVSGGSWQAITGATAAVSSFTPAVTGTLDIKIIATNAYSESSELSTTLTVLPTYTPTQISNTTVDINIPGTAKFQAQTQFTLSADLKALEYFDTTRAHLAHDNALYYLDSGEKQIIPLAETTGNTISSCYVGQYTGVITDISGNTAFYNYQTNDWQYIEQNSAAVLASTTTYAATISGTTLNLYNLNGNKVDDIESTLTNLAGNDAANTFAGYSGQTLTYYWITGNQLSSGSQTMAHTITDVHQVPGTENYVVSTTANTYIVSISSSGAYSQVMETDTADPLLHTQATTINVLIGVSDPNEIYVVGSDGETDGTYVSGSTLTDASIAKSTGLYAIAGGADFQAYILGKSESSTWQLTQVISFGEGVDYSQISTTGTYAAVATGLKLYLLEAVDVSTGTYMLQGVIIGSSGNPYAGKLISINGDQIRTDTSGRFLYPVTPNTRYTIVADTTTTEYTATSAALQQIAIRLKPNPFAQSVSYSATYNEDTGNFDMLYEDSRDLTQQVTWTIRETGDNTIVHQVTVQPGQTATWQVPFDKVFQGYQISMDAERGSINVENVWMITPAGSQPINIPGLDDTGKNIIFGCVLMIIAGLFGVMFSTKGAIFVVLAAGVMTFLGLLTIPWEIIIVAGLLAFLAALAKGGGGQ